MHKETDTPLSARQGATWPGRLFVFLAHHRNIQNEAHVASPICMSRKDNPGSSCHCNRRRNGCVRETGKSESEEVDQERQLLADESEARGRGAVYPWNSLQDEQMRMCSVLSFDCAYVQCFAIIHA